MKTVIILGSKGMLGQMVIKYFSKLNYKIIKFDQRLNEDNIFGVIHEINQLPDAVVINCIGKIKQKTDDTYTLLFSNTILPMELNRSLKTSHFLIQPSTDCVFSGESSVDYQTLDFNDAIDVYGWSKSLGEHALQYRENTLIIRVSIIGPDENSNKGLLSWFLNLENNSNTKGYTHHFWNGITTLEWCIFVEKYLQSPERYKLNTVQLGTREIYNKYEMLKMFKTVFKKAVNIEPFAEGVIVRKCLKPDIVNKNLLSQLQELRDFINN